MAAEVEEVRQDNDSVVRWYADEIGEPKYLGGLTVRNAYAAYTQWCDASGERTPCSIRTFSRRVIDRAAADVTERHRIYVDSTRHGGKTFRTFVYSPGDVTETGESSAVQ